MRLRTYNYRHAEIILNTRRRLKREIERVLQELELELPRPYGKCEIAPHRQIQLAFQKRGWQEEVLVSPDSGRRDRFDICKEGVAIEIELSSRERLYRDYYRFQIAESRGTLTVGVIILLDDDARFAHPCGMRNGLPRLEDVVEDLQSLNGTLPVPIWVVAVS